MKNFHSPTLSSRILLRPNWVTSASSFRLILGLLLSLGWPMVPAQAEESPATKDLILTAPDNGKTVNAWVGQRILVQLEGNPSTPYRWSFTTNGDSVVSTGPAEYTAYNPGVPGSSGLYSFPFKAMKAGTTSLDFAYSSLGNPQDPSSTFKVKIRVNEAISGPYLILTAEHEGRTLDVMMGTRIFVQLDGCVACGSEWLLLTTNGDSVVPTGNAVFTPDPVPPGTTGGSGYYSFPLQAMKEGTTELEFGFCPYGRPENPSSIFRVTLRVVEALILTSEDDGKTVEVSVGQRILVELEGGAGVPVRWVFTVQGDSVVFTGPEQYTPYIPDVVGGSGIYSYPFQAVKLGMTSLDFAYRMYVNPSDPPLATFGVTLRVVGPRLAITRAGSNIEVRWPMASSYGYFLEGTGSLSPPHWSAPNVLVVPDGPNYKAVLPVAGESLFFRLAK